MIWGSHLPLVLKHLCGVYFKFTWSYRRAIGANNSRGYGAVLLFRISWGFWDLLFWVVAVRLSSMLLLLRCKIDELGRPVLISSYFNICFTSFSEIFDEAYPQLVLNRFRLRMMSSHKGFQQSQLLHPREVYLTCLYNHWMPFYDKPVEIYHMSMLVSCWWCRQRRKADENEATVVSGLADVLRYFYENPTSISAQNNDDVRTMLSCNVLLFDSHWHRSRQLDGVNRLPGLATCNVGAARKQHMIGILFFSTWIIPVIRSQHVLKSISTWSSSVLMSFTPFRVCALHVYSFTISTWAITFKWNEEPPITYVA